MKKMKYLIGKRTILDFAFLVLTLALSLTHNNYIPDPKPMPNITPNYLLTGTHTATSGVFDYYDIGDGKLAVAVNDTFVSGSSITILNEYDDKPVTGIMHGGFSNISISSITIPNGIDTIDFEAFLYCDIEQIVIPYTVNRIGDAAFYGSTVEKVAFVNSNAEDAGSACSCDTPPVPSGSVIPSTLTTIPSFCFFHCKNLTTLSLPASVEEIAEEAFNGCSNLSSTLAFQSITTIRERAFQGCTSLRKIHISKSMFENASGVGIEPHAFNYCASKAELDFIFYGTDLKINEWLTNHPNWGWYSDRGNPSTDSYVIRQRKDGSTYFTSDWTYTVTTVNGVLEAEITGYNGPAPSDGYISIPDHMPTPAGNVVTKISPTALNEIKGSIERLYLPTTLVEIGNSMFCNGFNKLYVVDDNTQCATDALNPPATGRINLSGLDNLKYIGTHAFTKLTLANNAKKDPIADVSIGLDEYSTGVQYRDLITKIYLPAHLIAVGDEAFGVFGYSLLPKVIDFRWEYDSESCLETIGTDCFYGLGYDRTRDNLPKGNADYGDVVGNLSWIEHYASTIIFPKTFRHFGMTPNDLTNYNDSTKYTRTFNFTGEVIRKPERPAHAFEGCSLIKKVVFKGGADSANLIVPLQTFVYNESLQTIIFEERPEKYIAFHTQIGAGSGSNSDWAQESIGGNSGRDGNDFRGEPFLQSIFLPNKTTKIYIQSFAFHANARAAIYLSDEYGHNMYADKTRFTWTEMADGAYSWSETYDVDGKKISDGTVSTNDSAKQWRTIGNEEWYAAGHNARYYGYCYSSARDTKLGADASNNFSIDQKNPCYENVHYEETIQESYIASTNVVFGSGNDNEYVEENKCSFVCKTDTTRDEGKQKVAVMTNYLFNIKDGSNAESLQTCIIPKTITVDEVAYTVIEIGESAFSACFCDGKDVKPNVLVSSVNNIKYIVMPDTIEKIGDYAFIRAYAIEKISSYETNPASAEERMPKALEHIGKNAFTFSGIKKVLKIPFVCKFYENESNNYKVTSVFANALSLRKITFYDYDENAVDPEEQSYSEYYETTTYKSTSSGTPTYTSALYSTNDAGLSYKKNRLILLLNRDYADRTKESQNHSGTKDCVEYGSPATGVTFNALNKANPFVYGAYKMGYWLKGIKWNNNPTRSVEGTSGGSIYAQQLLSAIGKYDGYNFVDSYIYMGVATGLFSDLSCSLESVTGITDITKLPKYGFDGCEQLTDVDLPNQTAAMPDGVFVNGGNSVNYKTSTPASPEGATSGYLDLTGTNYTKVGTDSFKNNPNITHFIAPSVSTFEVGSAAFSGCSNLTHVDFSNVTGKLIINAGAFASSGVTSITWPTNPSCVVIIKDSTSTYGGAFSNCKSLTSVTLPANLKIKDDASNSSKALGSSTFSGCENLTTVTGTANSVDIIKIGDSAFSGCKKLDTFDFGIFTSNLTTIGNNAFQNCKTIANSGNISLPSNITTIGSNAFNGSKIVTMTINSSEISLGTAAFINCTALTAFRLTDHDCTWSSYNTQVFNGCTNLVELQLSEKYDVTRNYANTNFIKGDTAINIYSFKKYVNGLTAHDSWRKISNNNAKDVHYFVESVQNLIDETVVGSGPIKSTIWFWTTDSSGHAVRLGKVSSYDSGTGTVTFTIDGSSTSYTLTGNNFSPSIP